MRQTLNKTAPRNHEPEPTWDIAHLFPIQGQWCEDEYLALETNHLVELSNGFLEVLSMPTPAHQFLVFFLARLLEEFATRLDLGSVLLAPLRVRLWPRKFREPDVVFMAKEHADRLGQKYWRGADLVMEVVSPDPQDRHRDLVIKRQEYARAGIAEYWIVDPQEEQITVLRLAARRYVVHGEFARGAIASSHLLPGFTVDVTQAFKRQTPAGRPTRKPRRPSRQ